MTMGARIVWVVFVCACGRIGFEPAADKRADAVAPDASALGPFGSPTLIAELPTASWPSLTGDLLELYYDDPGVSGIFRSTRPDTSALWGTPVRVDELGGTFNDTDPGVSADGLRLWIASFRAGGVGKNDLWFSTRADRASPWSAPVLIAELNTSEEEFGPAPQPSETMILFSSFRTGNDDLYVAQRASAQDTWGAPTPLAELNTPSTDSMPFLVVDGLVIYFSSDRPGGMGARDLYMASRTSISEPFGPPVALTELNSSGDDDRPWLSPDQRTIIFASTRSGGFRLYEARR